MIAFRRYVAIKRQNAVWGDDPEVQALCEIYDRPAEIWSYDLQVCLSLFSLFDHLNTTCRYSSFYYSLMGLFISILCLS